MEIFTERFKLKDIMPEKSKDIAKQYNLKEENIEFIRKNTPLNPEDMKIEDGERAAIRYINTADPDRDSEIVLPSGGQVNDFKKSPTVLYAHNYSSLPIGRDAWIKLVQGKGWLVKTVYAKHQLAEDVYNLVKEKFLNTSSIGFIPLESVLPEDKGWDKTREVVKSEYGITDKLIDGVKRIYTKWLLLEHSDVPIPSNINALNIAVGKGLEIKSPELIEDLKIEIIDEEEKTSDEIIELEEEKQKEKEELFSDEFITKPEETESYIHLPAKGEEGKHSGHKIRTMDIDVKQGIKGKYCVDCKKMISFMFDKSKWTMAKAKKWMADHGKSIEDYYEKVDWEVEGTIEEIDWDKIEKKIFREEKKPDKGFSLTEIYEIIKENIELVKAMEDLTAELKSGAVLNRKNKSNLKNAQELIQIVLDSAEPVAEEDGEKSQNITIIEKEDNGKINIDEKELKGIIGSVISEIKAEQTKQINNGIIKITENVKEEIGDNFKRMTGKVM